MWPSFSQANPPSNTWEAERVIKKQSHKGPVTHTALVTLCFAVAIDSGVLMSSVQLCGGKCRRESYLHSAWPLKFLYCSPLSTTKFCINFLYLINHINLDLFEAKCILVSTGPAVLLCWDLFPEATISSREWDIWKRIKCKLEKIGFPLYELKVTLELSLLKCRFVKEIKIVNTCTAFI